MVDQIKIQNKIQSLNNLQKSRSRTTSGEASQKETSQAARSAGNDRIQISEASQLIRKAKTDSSQASARQDRVAELKRQVEEGEYLAGPEQVKALADRILDHILTVRS